MQRIGYQFLTVCVCGGGTQVLTILAEEAKPLV